MAAPVPTPRVTPSGIMLSDGFSTKITMANSTSVSFWEKNVQPPGFDGGEPVPQSTMFNILWHTKAGRVLIQMTDSEVTAAYDPNVINQIMGLINVPTTITITFPDGSTLAFFGFLQKFVPEGNEEGKQPEAKLTFVVTNWDYVNKVEAGPVLTSVSGT